MKKVLILLMALGLFACSSPEDVITDHLKENINDWDSYEPVSFGEIERSYVNDDTDPMFKIYKAKSKAFWEEMSKYSRWSKEYSRLQDSAVFYDDKWGSIMRPEGWHMSHTYRSSNVMGVKTIKTYWFFLDEKKKNIIRVDTVGAPAFGKDGLIYLGREISKKIDY